MLQKNTFELSAKVGAALFWKSWKNQNEKNWKKTKQTEIIEYDGL